MVLDMKADVEVNQEVDEEVVNVVDELVISGESADKCRCCAKIFSYPKSLKVHNVDCTWSLPTR